MIAIRLALSIRHRHSLTTMQTSSTKNELLFEQKKNAHLLHLLAQMRSSDSKTRSVEPSAESQSDDQLRRTYKKALSDYASVCEQLQNQTAHCSKQSTDLRTQLNEKEDKAEQISKTLAQYREHIARQSSYKNSKPFDMQHFEQLVAKSKDLDQEIEREQLKHTRHKVELSQLERRIKKKNSLAGGISQIEFHHLAADIKKSDDKLRYCETELQRNASNKHHLLGMESKLQDEIKSYRQKNELHEQQCREIDSEIDKRRGVLNRLESTAKDMKKKIGYESAEIGAYLKTRAITDDFASSADEVCRLQEQLKDLSSLYATLVKQT